MSNTTAERSIQVNGMQIRYREAGQGSPVVILRNSEEHTESPLQALLAQQFQVIVFEIPGLPSPEPRKIAGTLNQAAASIGLDNYVLIGTADSASLALWQAIDGDGASHIDGLVLISPTVLLPEGRAARQSHTRPRTTLGVVQFQYRDPRHT